MPIKKDEERRWVEMEILLPGTPEQVWHAMATGPGNAAWFVKAEIEPKVGGTFKLDFGQGVATTGEVTVWNPPHSFGYVEREWQEGAPPVATEIRITGRGPNQCVVRMVHSMFTSSDEWDDQVEGFEGGWPSFFAVLRLYLGHFAGEPASSFIAILPVVEDSLPAWLRLNAGLGLNGASVGEGREGLTGPESWSGVIEHVYQDAKQRWTLLRINRPTPGVILVGVYAGATLGGSAGTSISVCRYYYGTDATRQAAEGEGRWRNWLGETFEIAGAAPTDSSSA